jgi:hypothetical protein
MSWLSGWLYRKKLTVDATKVDADLTDFPVLVKLDETNFNFSHARSDGYDIRFTYDDGETLLKYEREFHGEIAGSYGTTFCIGGTASADSVNGGEIAANAFDNNTATFWTSALIAMPHWLKYDLSAGITKIGRKYRITPRRSGDSNGVPKDFKLQGSNDDSIWTDLDSQTNQSWADDTPKEYTFSNSTAYRYYRLYITNSFGGTYVQIKELEIMEYIEPYNEAYYWVKLPIIDDIVDTDFYIYYGKSDAADGADSTNVWDSYHKGVWHLKESGSGIVGEYKDSTVNANHGQGVSAPTCVDGKIYKCQQFASNKKINIPDAPILELGSQNFTISMKVLFIAFGGNWGLLGRAEGASYFYVGADSGVGTALRFRDYGSGGAIDWSVNPAFSLATWYDLEITRNGSNFKVFKDGIQVGSTQVDPDALVDRAQGWQIGNVFDTGYFINGYMDEVRFSIGIDRDAAWRTTRIASDDLSLLNFGEEELLPNFVDLDTDIRISEQIIEDINIDIRVKLEEHFKDLDIDLRVGSQLIEDINTDIRVKLEEHFKDIDLDIRAVAQTLENINIDIRVAEDVIKDIITDIRAAKSVIKDIDTDIRVVARSFSDINTDIRISHRISANNITISSLYLEEGYFLSVKDVVINMEVFGAVKMQFKNGGGAWSTLEPYANTKNWSVSVGDGDKKIYARFTDMEGNLSDGTDLIEAILNTITPYSVIIEAYTDDTATVAIPDSTYQTYKKPFFRWKVPEFNIPYIGFSVALDDVPDDIIDVRIPTLIRNGMEITKAVPLPEMTVTMATGFYYSDLDLRETSSQDLTLDNGGLKDRIDIIYIDSVFGVLSVIKGEENDSPIRPDTIVGAIELAEAYVPAGTVNIVDVTLIDIRQQYIELRTYLYEALSLGQHTFKVKGICVNGLISDIATFNIWIANDSPIMGEIKCYTDITKLVELANGLYQISDNTPYFEWTVAPAEPGPIRYYYTEDGTEPDISDSFLTTNNYIPGAYSEGITILKIKPYDVTTGYWGETKSFIFIYGTQTFTDDTAVICGNTILRQSLKEVHVKEISWDFNSARICRFFQPVAFDTTLPFSEGNTISVIYGSGNTTLFRGRIMQIERTIDIGQEGVMYHCSGPRQDLAEEYAYIVHDDYGETTQITFDDVPLGTAIDTIISKFPTIVKKVESYPSGATISDEYIGQIVSSVLDSIYAKTKYGWYMRPNGSLVSVDLTTINSGEAKFGIYGTTVHPISPQYNVMAANLQFDITNRYNKCIIEGARKKERAILFATCTAGPFYTGQQNWPSSDDAFKIYKIDTKWEVVKLIKTFVNYKKALGIITIPNVDYTPGQVSTTMLTIIGAMTICKDNMIYTTERPDTVALAGWNQHMYYPTGGGGVVEVFRGEQAQGSLSPLNTIRFSNEIYNYWPNSVVVGQSFSPGTPWDEMMSISRAAWAYKEFLNKKCASVKADVIIETIPLKVEVTVSGTASSISKTLRIINTSFIYSEDPDDLADDTVRMTEYAEDLLEKYKDIKVNGSITLDTIDLTWDLDKTVNLINTDQGSWSSLNAKVIGIKYDFDMNTTTLEITSEYLK